MAMNAHQDKHISGFENHLDNKMTANTALMINSPVISTEISKGSASVSMHSDPILSQKDKSNVACCDLNTEVMSVVEPKEINGCKVFMHFSDQENPQVQISIANLLIEAFLKRRETA